MSFWNTFFDWFSWSDATDLEQGSLCPIEDAACSINPATGILMIGGCGGVDAAGNPYGVDLSSHHDCCLGDMDSCSDWLDISGSSDPFPPWID